MLGITLPDKKSNTRIRLRVHIDGLATFLVSKTAGGLLERQSGHQGSENETERGQRQQGPTIRHDSSTPHIDRKWMRSTIEGVLQPEWEYPGFGSLTWHKRIHTYVHSVHTTFVGSQYKGLFTQLCLDWHKVEICLEQAIFLLVRFAVSLQGNAWQSFNLCYLSTDISKIFHLKQFQASYTH